MLQWFDSWHDAMTWAVIALCFLGVIHPRLPTGVLGTAGLGACIVAMLYSLDWTHDATRALDLMIGGLGLIGVCLAIRVVRRPHRGLLRRVEDWHHEAVKPLEDRHHDAVQGGAKE